MVYCKFDGQGAIDKIELIVIVRLNRIDQDLQAIDKMIDNFKSLKEGLASQTEENGGNREKRKLKYIRMR